MKQGKKIVCVITARLGSRRIMAKNLRLLAGRPLIYYAIQAVKGVESFDEIYVNSESEAIGKVAQRYGIPFYPRPAELAKDDSTLDEYIYEFLVHVECDVLVLVMPTSPFLSSAEIDRAIDYFLDQGFDTMVGCKIIQAACFFDGEPINFSTLRRDPRSQDLKPVQALNYAITIWDSHKFVQQFEERGYGTFTGRIGLYGLEGVSTIDIDGEEDFVLAEAVMEGLARGSTSQALYDEVMSEELRI